jgi:hypothetical protein
VTAGLLGVDEQGVPAPGRPDTEVPNKPGYDDSWTDLRTGQAVRD